jgi:hypothetical protein
MEMLRSFEKHDEIVLWFEHDLFCQLNLLYLLNWFGNLELGNTRLSLINVGAFPGKENFRGIGELNADELASLFPERREVTDVEFKLAQAAWKRFAQPILLRSKRCSRLTLPALPFLSKVLHAHLRRFPQPEMVWEKLKTRVLS